MRTWTWRRPRADRSAPANRGAHRKGAQKRGRMAALATARDGAARGGYARHVCSSGLRPACARAIGSQSVTLVLADSDHEIRHLLMVQGQPPAQFRQRPVRRRDARARAADRARPAPLARQVRALRTRAVVSCGRADRERRVVAAARQDRLIGSLNFGSAESRRFTRESRDRFSSSHRRDRGVLARERREPRAA